MAESVTGHSWPAATVERIVAAWINNAKFMDEHEDVEGVGFERALLEALAREAGAVEVRITRRPWQDGGGYGIDMVPSDFEMPKYALVIPMEGSDDGDA